MSFSLNQLKQCASIWITAFAHYCAQNLWNSCYTETLIAHPVNLKPGGWVDGMRGGIFDALLSTSGAIEFSRSGSKELSRQEIDAQSLELEAQQL